MNKDFIAASETLHLFDVIMTKDGKRESSEITYIRKVYI
jgi:hypothetical protein